MPSRGTGLLKRNPPTNGASVKQGANLPLTAHICASVDHGERWRKGWSPLLARPPLDAPECLTLEVISATVFFKPRVPMPLIQFGILLGALTRLHGSSTPRIRECRSRGTFDQSITSSKTSSTVLDSVDLTFNRRLTSLAADCLLQRGEYR